MRAIIAELAVEDVDASVYWYRDLGFEIELEGLSDEDGLQWVSLVHEGRTLWLLRADMAPFEGDGAPRASLYLPVADVDALYNHIMQRGLQVETAPRDQWYGLREFSLRDPDGFRWVINQPLSPDETPPPPARPV